jgi:uncharacterized membrane protein
MLVALPIGLWIFSLASDVIYVTHWGGIVWKDVAFYTMGGGIVTALLAALPGFVDFLSLKERRVKTLAVFHMMINLLVVAMFAANWWLRRASAPDATIPVWLSVIGVVLLGISGWLGGEMVYVHGVAVEPHRGAEGSAAERGAPRRAA